MSVSGKARIGGVALNKIIEWNFDTPHPTDNQVKGAYTNPKSVYGFGHMDFYRHCLDALENGKDELVSRREGRKTVEIIEAAYQSALSGGQVRMGAMRR